MCHIHWALHYLKSHKCYEDTTISKGLSNDETLIFSETEPVEENLERVHEKFIQNEPLFTLTEDSLNMHITASNEITLVSQVPIIIKHQGKKKTPSVLNDGMCEELAFS